LGRHRRTGRHLKQFSDALQIQNNRIAIDIPTDENGFLGRECPAPDCQQYFKVMPGTGITGVLDCRCPYCGHTAEHEQFYTRAQIEYAKSIVMNQVTNAVIKDLKALEFEHRPRGGFGLGISMKVKGRPTPISYYQEQQLETDIECTNCTLRYTIYGLFAFCPDCGEHNSLHILTKNFELAAKEITMAATAEPDLAEYLINDSLENAVAAFDGFGREACRVRVHAATKPTQAENLRFQNLNGAQRNVQSLFGFDLANGVSPDEWNFAGRCFQKRHLLAHKMGVIDQEYITHTGDPQAVIGRKVVIRPDEVTTLIDILKKLGTFLVSNLPK
jgi:hypothetical protein